MSCNDKISNRCGKKINATCVDYKGVLLAGTTLPACGNSLETVLEDVVDSIDDIKTNSDLTSLPDTCVDYTTVGGKITVKNAILGLNTKMVEVMEFVGMSCDNCPSCGDDCPSIFTKDITCLNLDLGTLADPCNHPPSTLKDLLQAILTKLATL